MARWRLVAPHYLNVPGIEWEYKEVDRTTGRPKRATFAVPLLLDPSQPSDWNYQHGRDEGEIIVCLEGRGQPRDIIFEGDPTPDMVPLDDEAQELSAAFATKWKHPIESLEGSYADKLLDGLQSELAKVQAATNRPAQVEGMAELLAAMTSVMKQNAELLAALAAKPAAERRV